MQTFRDLQLEVLRWIDEASDTNVTLALVKDAINRSHRQVLSNRTWPFMAWPREESFTTTAGIRSYALKAGVNKVKTLYDADSRTPFPLTSRREWETLGVNRVDSQLTPLGAIYGDVWPVAAQPSAAVVTVTSSSSSDTAVTVILSGINSSGDATTETIMATGQSAASGSVLWSHLWSVTKTGTWIGTLTLVSGSTTLLTLTPPESGKQYPTLEFIETPASARTYLYTAQRTPSTLTNDTDIPDTPYPYAAIHAYDALLDLTTYNTELGAKEQRLWEARRTELWEGLLNSVEETIAGARPKFVRNMNVVRRVQPYRTTS